MRRRVPTRESRLGGGLVSRADPRRCTVVAFHAHPDDEALLSGGTLARLAAEGHRVVLVTATRGELGLTRASISRGENLAHTRMRELEASATALGCARVVWLGYTDSGLHGESTDPSAFVRIEVETSAHELAEILSDESADALIIYDRNGGYGHPDHVQVHRVGSRASVLAGTRVVLEATVPATAFRAAVRVAERLERAGFSRFGALAHPPAGADALFSPSRDITHRVPVWKTLSSKRRALRAHRSQQEADTQDRALERILRLPRPIFALLFAHEWFVEQGGSRRPGREPDVLATLRTTPAGRARATGCTRASMGRPDGDEART